MNDCTTLPFIDELKDHFHPYPDVVRNIPSCIHHPVFTKIIGDITVFVYEGSTVKKLISSGKHHIYR